MTINNLKHCSVAAAKAQNTKSKIWKHTHKKLKLCRTCPGVIGPTITIFARKIKRSHPPLVQPDLGKIRLETHAHLCGFCGSGCLGFRRCRELADGWGRGRGLGSRFTLPVVGVCRRTDLSFSSLITVTSWITIVSSKILLRRSICGFQLPRSAGRGGVAASFGWERWGGCKWLVRQA